MKIIEVDIDTIIKYARNPRRNQNAIGKVAASIREFGFRQPLVIDPENVVVAGHTRLEAARMLGLRKVPVHVATGLTPQQIKAFRLADNRTADDAEWDRELLKLELEEITDTETTGFESEEVEEIIRELVFNPTDEEDQPDLGVIDPKYVSCPHCGKEFNLNEKG